MTVTHRKVLAGADGSNSAVVRPQADWNDTHVVGNVTMSLPEIFWFWNRRTSAYPVHGASGISTLNQSGAPYISQADADASYALLNTRLKVPLNFISGLTLHWIWSSSVGGNAATFDVSLRTQAGGQTSDSSAFASSVNVAVPAGANTFVETTMAISGVAAGDALTMEFAMDTNAAGDTNTGIRYLWHAWFEYTGNPVV